jgi:hypothetical protein
LPGEALSDRSVLLERELHVPPGDYRLVAVVQDQLAEVVAAATVDLVVGAGRSRLGAVHLGIIDPASIPLEQTDEKPAGKKRKGRDNPVMLMPSLPVATRILNGSALEAGNMAFLLYGVCAPRTEPAQTGPDGDAFSGWKLVRTLKCGTEAVSLPLAGHRLESPDDAERCVLVLDRLPESLEPGVCRFEVILERPGVPAESRALGFEVTSPGAGD